MARPASYSSADDRSTVSLLQRLNGKHLERYPGDADLAARIASYELAGKMQTSIPEVMDLSNEPNSIREEYGMDSGTVLKKEYAKKGEEIGELIQYSVPNLDCYRINNVECENASLCSQQTINLPVHNSV